MQDGGGSGAFVFKYLSLFLNEMDSLSYRLRMVVCSVFISGGIWLFPPIFMKALIRFVNSVVAKVSKGITFTINVMDCFRKVSETNISAP